ncbi:sensor histidine kinase [Dielma fastidiosa]|uniref:sensor histidine kinase n=1 Tax=Dielma fastidiosa TaxID=1034346 RepID=UPI000ED1DFD3|nr:HAMP domain-containing sensor histidine kinase [Dielma fastidiosa]HAH92370.1 hypothetical protein [Dielma fastidiosa]
MKKISLRWRVTIAAAFVLTLFCVAMTQSSIRDANLIIADPILKLRTEAIADPILNGDQNFSPDTALDETVYNGLDNFTQRSYLFMLAAIGGGSFLVYLLAGYSLQPVKKLSSSIEAISEKQLSSRIQGFDSKDEIAKLADDFNAMMDRLEIAFLREKRFSSNAAHELRTPLTIIRTNLEILAMNETPAIEDYEHVVKIIKKQNQRMIALVEDLFALSAMKSSSIEDVFDVKEIIADIIREMQPLANQRNIDIQSELSSGLIKGNPIIFRQAVANLIENGIKYNTEQGTLKVRSLIEKNQYIIAVEDTGIGIDQEQAAHIFEPFYRIENSRSRNTAGAGLGLALCREIIEGHGGSVAYSPLEHGSLFTIQLPLNQNLTAVNEPD